MWAGRAEGAAQSMLVAERGSDALLYDSAIHVTCSIRLEFGLNVPRIRGRVELQEASREYTYVLCVYSSPIVPGQ